MFRKRTVPISVLVAATLTLTLASGCAARFSPGSIRNEITLQRGQDPLSVFELNLGRFTTLLLKSAMTTEDGDIPFGGLSQLQLAVYESPGSRAPALDVTRIETRGWEAVVRVHDEARSAMVLVRTPRGTKWRSTDSLPGIGDLVLVGAGKRNVVYARLRGTLSSDLPRSLGDAFRSGGPEEIQRVLTDLAEGGNGG